MEQEIKKNLFLILGLIIFACLSGVFIYVYEQSYNQIIPHYYTSNIILHTPELVDSEDKEEQPNKETKSQPQPGKVNFDVRNIEGQLVKHLFDIESVPSPKGVAFTSDGKEIWSTLLLNKSRGVSIFSTLNGKKIKDINLENGGGVEVIFSSDGKRAYVSQMETARIFEIDTQTKEILRIFESQSTWTKEMEFSKDEKFLYASNWCGDDVSEIDIKNGELKRRISTVDTPRGIYVTFDNNLYVSGFANGDIQKIDLKTGKKEILLTTNGAMRHIAADEVDKILYFSDMGTDSIWKLYLETDEVEKFAGTDHNPNTIVLSPDNKILFVSCRGINSSADNYYVPGPEWGSVMLFDTETGDMLDAIIGGNQPTALAVSSDGKRLVFSDFLDGRLEVFEIPCYEILKQGNGGISSFYKKYLKK